MNRQVKITIKIIFAIIILSCAGVYLWIHRSELTLLRKVSSIDLCLISGIMLFWLIISGYIFKLLISLLDVKLTLFESFGLMILTSFGNYLGPLRPGAAIKAVYLKKVKGLQYAKFTSVLLANSVLILFVNGFTALVLIFLFFIHNIHVPSIIVYLCIGLTASTMLPFFYKFTKFPVKGKLGELIQSALAGFNTIYTHKIKLLGICLTLLLQMLTAALLFLVIYRSIGIPIDYYTSLFIGVFASISSFFSITPNNIGIQETTVAFILSLTGFDFTAGVIGAGLLRIVHIIITFVFAPLIIHFLFNTNKIKPFQKME